LSLFFQQAIGLQTRELPERNPALKHQVLMLLDEFTALGRIPILAEAISYLPGYNVRVVLVIQTPAQLREVYGIHNAEVMLKSLAARIVFAPKDFPDAKEISDELGFTTVKVKTLSRSSDLFESRGRRAQSVSLSEERRALLLPQEVKELGTEEAIVFYEGLRPIRCRKIRYFAEGAFRKRLLPPPSYPIPGGPTAQPASTTSSSSSEDSEVVPAPLPPKPPEGTAAPDEKETVVIREVTPEDIEERIDSMTWQDFARDFSRLQYPKSAGPLSEREMTALVDGFVATLEQ
jgi:type IV secretion system protein VirD4